MSNYYLSERHEMLKYLPTQMATCLDVGCGAGAFAHSVKQQYSNCSVWGVEIMEPAALQAKDKLDHVICASAEAALAELPDHYFDCIIFNDVLEHLVDPYAFLANIKCKLKPGAAVIASLPNIRHYKVLFDLLVHAEWRYTDAGVLDRTHLRFFTYKSMRRLFEDAGFIIQRQEGLSGSRKVKVRIWGWASFGALRDIRFPQFALVATQKT